MSIAIGVLLFFCAFVTLYRGVISLSMSRKWLMYLFCIINVAAGVLNIVCDIQSVQIVIGILLCIWTVIAIVILIWAARAAEGGSGIGYMVLGGAILFFVWVITFMVLQFSIVV